MSRRPLFRPEQYREIGWRLDDMARLIGKRRAHLGGPLDSGSEIIAELRDEIAAGGPTGAHVVMSLRTIRDLAWWAGADKVGATLDDACYALASAWFRGVRLSRASLGDPSARASWQRVRLKFVDDAADITVDGCDVGYIERLVTEEFRSASSYARKTLVTGYSVTLWDMRAECDGSFETRAAARAHVVAELARLGTLRAHAKVIS